MATTKRSFALTRFKLSSEEKKKRYGIFFRGGHFTALTRELAFWATSSACELLELSTGARTDLGQAPGKYVRFVASSRAGDAVLVCDGDGWVRLMPIDPTKRKLGKLVRKQLEPHGGAAFSDELVALSVSTYSKGKTSYSVSLHARATLERRKTITASEPVVFGKDVVLIPSAKGFGVWRAPFTSASIEVACSPEVRLEAVSDDGAFALGVRDDEVLCFDLVKGKRVGAVKLLAAKGLELETLTDVVRLHPLGADTFVRLSMDRDMNGNIEEVAVEKWSLSGKRLARAEERILSSKKLLGLAEQALLTNEVVLLNRELFVRL